MNEQCSVSDSISRLNSSLSFDPPLLRGVSKRACLPPIREGQLQSSSGDFETHGDENASENEGAGLGRRFSLPSITSFDYPAPSSPTNRKLSLTESAESQPSNLHLCKYPGCNWSFKRGEHLKRHMAVHTRERPFPCSFPGCKRSFSRIDNLNVHFRTHSDCFATATSPSFSHQFVKREPLETDFSDKETLPPPNPSPTPVTRKYSGYDFSGLESLATAACSAMAPASILYQPQKEEEDTKIVWTDLDEDGRPTKYYVCQFRNCNMKFKRSEHLTRHRLVHTMERPFTCSYPGCNKAFSRMDNLRQHFRIHSRPNSQASHFLPVTDHYPPSHPYPPKRHF